MGMKQKTIEFFHEFVLSKEILSIRPRRADSRPNRKNLFSIEKFGNDTKTFWFRFQNDIGTFVLSFLTLLWWLSAQRVSQTQRNGPQLWGHGEPCVHSRRVSGVSFMFFMFKTVHQEYIQPNRNSAYIHPWRMYSISILNRAVYPP